MKYAKIIDGKLEYWTGHVIEDGKDIFSNDPEAYGYKPVIYRQPEEREGYIAVFDGWEETETEIHPKWKYEINSLAIE